MKDQIKLKVCGMREPANIGEVAATRPDYMGFIFYPKSPRYVGDEFVLPAGFPGEISKVGVFVNESTEQMLSHVERLSLDYLQLHGDESVSQVEALKASGVKVIKVFSVDDMFDFTKLVPYENHVDFFLFDTKGKYYGGNAMAFDWSVLERYNQKVPFFLSGGISPENVADVRSLKGMNIHALDINSGVESSPAMKDPTLILRLRELMNDK